MDIVETVVTIIERIGFPALVGLLLFALIYQLVKAFREDQKRRERADARDAELRNKLLDLDTRNSRLAAQNSEQIDLLRKSLEQVSASEALALERNLAAVEANTIAIQSNTEQMATMQQAFVVQLARMVEEVGAGQRAITAHIDSLAEVAAQERQQLLTVQGEVAHGLGVLTGSVQAQTADIQLLTSAVNAEQQGNVEAHRQQKQDAQQMAEEFHRLAKLVEGLPEQVAVALRPTLEPLVSAVQRLLERFEAPPVAVARSGGVADT